jgi:hypothetical protein
MAEGTPQVVQTQEETQAQKMDIFELMNKYNVGVPVSVEKVFTKLPKVFVDGWSLVKVSLTNKFENCGQYISRSGASFSGCAKYDVSNDKIEATRGIYYVPISPLMTINSRRKLAGKIDEMFEKVKKIVQDLVKDETVVRELLIVYDNYDNYVIKIYDRFEKGQMLKFPLKERQGHLFISQVPRITVPLKYEMVNEIQIYNHKISFSKEVVRFDISVFGGDAQLIYNHNEETVSAKLVSPDHGEKMVSLYREELYLFTHPKPQRSQD